MSQNSTLTLGDQIDETIRQNGPLSLSTYMRLCLTHPTLGYYRRTQPIGKSGDFVTAPEISQVFGESIGLWIAVLQRALDSAIAVVELGPGRGTLMNDALRASVKSGAGQHVQSLTLLETNPVLKDTQAAALAQYRPNWIEELHQIPEDGPPLVIIANEFFDALPIKQYQKSQGQWHERVIGLVENSRAWGLSPTPMPLQNLPEFLQNAPDGAIWEAAPTAEVVMTELAERIQKRGGALLALDYGYEKTQVGDTFQALENHAFADPLAAPGHADLTAHVDFEALARAAQQIGAQAHTLQTQDAFLSAMGARDRTKALCNATPERTTEFSENLERLVGRDQMGNLFKVLCVSSINLSPYPFSPALNEDT